MEPSSRSGYPTERRVGMAALCVFERDRDRDGAAARFDRGSGGALTRLLDSGDFSSRWLETALLYPTRGSKAARVLVVGLGARADCTPTRLMQAAAGASRPPRPFRAGPPA